MPGYHTFYSGSTVLAPLADYLGLRVDQVNFVICQLVSLITAAIYYRFLSPKKVSTTVRLFIPLVCGVSICFFCFGPLVFIVAMSYLSFIHYYRIFHARNYLIDITGPMMVLTQKVTSLAFSLHDGAVKKDSELTHIQKKELVRKVPSLLEYFSYAYNFQSVLCGPLCFYSDYIAFINGKHYVQTDNDKITTLNNNLPSPLTEPSPWLSVFEKLTICLGCLLVSVFLVPSWPPEAALELNYGFVAKFAYIMFSLQLIRTQYYFAWVMADAINNAAGFGFNGYDDNGKPRWDLVSNIKIWTFETSDNLRDSLAAWNCGTMYWLRRVAYERTSHRYRTIYTYVLSAWWHGFFPGYYATFLSGALFTEASRTGRRYLRPYFLDSSSKKFFYDCVTFIWIRFAIAYVGITFILLHLNATIKIYCQLYFFMHIILIAMLVFVPRIMPKKSIDGEKSKRL